jgi:hypothetical protein
MSFDFLKVFASVFPELSGWDSLFPGVNVAVGVANSLLLIPLLGSVFRRMGKNFFFFFGLFWFWFPFLVDFVFVYLLCLRFLVSYFVCFRFYSRQYSVNDSCHSIWIKVNK